MSSMLERLQQQVRDGVPTSPIAQFVGWRLVEVEQGAATMELIGEPHHTNPRGAVHGGVLSAMSQAAMAAAFGSTLGEGEASTTVELKINFLRPAPQARMLARARLIHRGRNLSVAECAVTDENERLIARASATFMLLKK